jgi:sugar lactone lactonase YvrE
MPIPTSISALRLATTLLFAAVLTGCASDQIRGQFKVDHRSEKERRDAVWPQPPDKPRYRYVGELVGEPNFERIDNSAHGLQTALHWIVGLFEADEQLLLQRPQYGVVSDSGRIYVVDTGRSAVMVFDPNPPADEKDKKGGGQLLLWDALNATTRFESPVAVALAWNGDVVVSDVAHGAVLRLNDRGELLGKIGAGLLKRPTGLAFDAERGLLYVADTIAHDIKVFDASGMLVDTVGTPGESASEFNAPTHLSFAGGHLYVSDTFNNRIQVFDREGRHARSFGERGLHIGNFARPKGVAVDDAGIVYVVESYFSHLLAYNANGQLLLGMKGSGLPEGDFLLPAGVWTDKRGQVYVADMFNGRVVVFQFLGNTTE